MTSTSRTMDSTRKDPNNDTSDDQETMSSPLSVPAELSDDIDGVLAREFSSDDEAEGIEESMTEDSIAHDDTLELGADQPSAVSSLLVRANKWFDDKNPGLADLITDMGASDVFIIEGDSLIVHVLANEKVDWTRGVQILQGIYLVERFLSRLQERGCQFVIAFFDVMNARWTGCESILLFRSVLKRHLKSVLTDTKAFVEFDDWKGPAWKKYVQDTAPSFVFADDGEFFMQDAEEEEEEFEFDENQTVLPCRAFLLYHSVCLKVHLALLPDVTFDGRFIYAYVIRHYTPPHLVLSPQTITANNLLLVPTVHTNDRLEPLRKQALKRFSLDGHKHSSGLDAHFGLTCAALSVLFGQPGTDTADSMLLFGKTVLLSSIYLKYIPLHLRSFVFPIQDQVHVLHDPFRAFVDRFVLELKGVFDAAEHCLTDNVVDLFDGRLTRCLFSLMLPHVHDMSNLPIDPSVSRLLNRLWELVTKGDLEVEMDDELPSALTDAQQCLQFQDELDQSLQSISTPVFRPFQSELVDSLAQLHPEDSLCRALLLSGSEGAEGITDGGICWYPDNQHWHSKKPLEDISLVAEKEKKQATTKKDLIMKQKNQRHIERYAKSLTGSDLLHHPIIRTKSGSKTANSTNSTNATVKPEKKESKKAAQFKKDNDERLKKDLADREEKKWKELMKKPSKDVEKIKDLNYLKKSVGSPSVRLKVFKALLESLLNRLSTASKDDQSETATVIHVELFEMIVDLTDEPNLLLDDGLKPLVRSALLKMRCYRLARLLGVLSEEVTIEDESTQDRSASFQLLHVGPRMRYDTGGLPDPRVKFIPDRWQRQALDIVDKKQSALICAPTSAGKTFICYYVMEKVLRSNETDLVVYVAPTKALVNQIAAEVYARFGKTTAKPGHSIVGVFTRDYRDSYSTCQVLVTVPQCLEILLLSLSCGLDWNRRIKYVIFDEVHCINDKESGAFWEHNLSVIQCPFLALSATIGNAAQFHQWLSDMHVQDTVHLIEHHERSTDLNKFIYVRQERKIQPLNPIYLIDREMLVQGSIPSDLALSSSETYELFTLMKSLADEQGWTRFSVDMNPETVFKDTVILTRKHVTSYRILLLRELNTWVHERPDLIDKLVELFSQHIPDDTTRRNLNGVHGSKEDIRDFMMPLLRLLQSKKDLPVVVFNFEKQECEKLAFLVAKFLYQAQERKRKQFQDLHKVQIEQLKNQILQLEKNLDSVKNDGHKSQIQDEIQNLNAEIVRLSGKHMCEETSFTLSVDEETDRRLRYGLPEGPRYDQLRRALAVGVGVHHAGLERKYLREMEILFRSGHLKVVFATGTLAYGINMPARTVVFAGDSTFLNTLMYRQMSGRAGRRGFDTAGKVIFLCLPVGKIRRLVTSPVASLTGVFPLSVTLVMRMLLLHKQAPTSDKALAESAMLGLLRTPLYASNKHVSRDDLIHHFRFSIEYLQRVNLLSASSQPMQLSYLVSHLFYTEPSNLMFTFLLQAGVFDEICPSEVIDKDTVRPLLELLCHIFGRKPVHPSVVRNRSGPSKVILPPLHESIYEQMKNYNSKAQEVFTDYLTFLSHTSNLNDPSTAHRLPYSKLNFMVGNHYSTQQSGYCKDIVANEKDALLSYLGTNNRPTVLCSPFNGLGTENPDEFASMRSLMENYRENIRIPSFSIPVFDLSISNSLNAYVLDFYKHGQLKALTEFNGLSPNESWQAIKDFSLILLSISTALKQMYEAGQQATSGGREQNVRAEGNLTHATNNNNERQVSGRGHADDEEEEEEEEEEKEQEQNVAENWFDVSDTDDPTQNLHTHTTQTTAETHSTNLSTLHDNGSQPNNMESVRVQAEDSLLIQQRVIAAFEFLSESFKAKLYDAN